MLFSTAYKVRVGMLFSTDVSGMLFSTTYKVRVFLFNACQELSETVNNAEYSFAGLQRVGERTNVSFALVGMQSLNV